MGAGASITHEEHTSLLRALETVMKMTWLSGKIVEQKDNNMRHIEECIATIFTWPSWYLGAYPKAHESKQFPHLMPDLNQVGTY